MLASKTISNALKGFLTSRSLVPESLLITLLHGWGKCLQSHQSRWSCLGIFRVQYSFWLGPIQKHWYLPSHPFLFSATHYWLLELPLTMKGNENTRERSPGPSTTTKAKTGIQETTVTPPQCQSAASVLLWEKWSTADCFSKTNPVVNKSYFTQVILICFAEKNIVYGAQ